jgi:hypothetical protein
MVLLAAVLALLPGAALATYTGVQDSTTFGTVAAGGGWIVVPRYEEDSDPGTIDGSPFNNTTSSLEVSRALGTRYISFRQVSARYSSTMGPMRAAGAGKTLALAWTDAAGAGQIHDATFGAGGNLSETVMQGVPIGNSLALVTGLDGAYGVSWTDGSGAHVMVAPAGAPGLTALLASAVPLDPADHVVLSGGESFWLIDDAGGRVSAAAALFGQDSTPQPATVLAAADPTELGDDAGGIWMLARGNRGWFASHLSRAGTLRTTSLPAGVTDPVIAVAGSTAVIAYRAGPRCASYIERVGAGASARGSTVRTNLAPRAAGCPTPTSIVVDQASATAYVLLRSRHGTTLATEMTNRDTSGWRGWLTERVDALVAVGSNRVVVESNQRARSTGEQCGGAGPSSSQAYFLRVFRRSQLQRTGRLEASVLNC